MPDKQYVFVHIWEDNASVYADAESALEGITGNYDEYEVAVVRAALRKAFENPGDAAYLDGGMSNIRYMGIY